MIKREELEKTESLEEAISLIQGVKICGRSTLFEQEGMSGKVAEAYFELGLHSRRKTYQNIVKDFKNRTGCYACNHCNYDIGTILDVGCGPGLLSVELAEHTGAKIVGLDVSSDMLALAKGYLEERTREKERSIREFQQRYKESSNNKNPLFNVEFIEGNVYELSKLTEPVNYIVCRNVLHRFKDPRKAIQEMYKTLSPTGKIYLRDLRRDADWRTIVERINGRWDNSELVEDYFKAMAGMFTIDEVKGFLDKSQYNYQIGLGDYLMQDKSPEESSLNEFAGEVEWVCVIDKSSKLYI